MSVTSVSTSPFSLSSPGWQADAGQPDASPRSGIHTCSASSCPFCPTQAFQASGPGQIMTGQVAGAAVTAGAVEQSRPAGDRISFAHRPGQPRSRHVDHLARVPEVGIGLDRGYGPNARPLAGAVHDHRPEQDKPVDRRRSMDETEHPALDEQASDSDMDRTSLDDEASPAGLVDERDLSADERRMLEELRQRDAEVRAHEQAHISAGGPYVRGGANYRYQTGPDGRQYAVGGEVSIDTSAVPGDPEQTEQKAQTVRRAALAPANPSAQDLKVAASASQMEAEARAEKLRARQEEQHQLGPRGKDERVSRQDASRADSDVPDAWAPWAGHASFGHIDSASPPGMFQGSLQSAIRAYQSQFALYFQETQGRNEINE